MTAAGQWPAGQLLELFRRCGQRFPAAAAVSATLSGLMADAQTSGGLLVAGELPGATVIGELVPRRDSVLVIR